MFLLHLACGVEWESLDNLEAPISRPAKQHWTPSEGAFRRFLDWLDEGTHSDGERYLEMRQRIEHFFERRDCRFPEDLADEVLNRVARRLEEEGTIDTPSPAHYCYVVAKFVFHEYLREANRMADVSPDDSAIGRRIRLLREEDPSSRERLLDQLDHCLGTLAPADRELIVTYYRGERGLKIEQRKSLAAGLGLTANALTIRAARLRARLETCIRSMLAQ